jgi:hypothetical protein
LKVSISYGRKDGRPSYSSESASVTLETEIDDPSAVPALARSLFVKARNIVNAELTSQPAEPVSPRRESPAPAGPAGRPFRESAPPPSRNGSAPPPRGDRPGDGPTDRPPTTGKALFAWVKRQEETTGLDVMRPLQAWAKRQGLPGRFSDWTPEEVADGVSVARKQLAAMQATG